MPDLLRSAIRTLRRSPTYFVLSAGTLGLGIGLSTATFAYVRATLNPTLPYAQPSRLYWADYRFWDTRHMPPLSSQIAALHDVPAIEGVTVLTHSDRRSIVHAFGVSAEARGITRFAPDFFEVMAFRPSHGRLPTAQEVKTASAALISAQMWHQAFHDEPSLGDASVVSDGVTIPIVGVLPAEVLIGTDIWIPHRSDADVDAPNAGGSR